MEETNFKVIVAIKFVPEVSLNIGCTIAVGDKRKDANLPLLEVTKTYYIRDNSLIL